LAGLAIATTGVDDAGIAGVVDDVIVIVIVLDVVDTPLASLATAKKLYPPAAILLSTKLNGELLLEASNTPDPL